MDRAIEKKIWTPNRIMWIGGGIFAALVLVFLLFKAPGSSTLRIDSSRITTSTATIGTFEDYYPFNARVEPLVSVYIDVEQGGRVEEILVEGGREVEAGELILRLSNANLQRSSIDTEARLLESIERAQQTQFSRAQSQIQLEEQLLNLDYQILDLQKRYDRFQNLIGEGAISAENFEQVEDELNYLKERRELLQRRISTESEITERQIAQSQDSIERTTAALELLSASVEALNVRAPISGHLSSVNAQLGESISPGYRIGQIDVLDEFKLRAEIDQYYISQVSLGTIGQLRYNGGELDVEVTRIYPEIVDNVFTVDMGFIGLPPEGLRRGQTLTVELSFGAPVETLMVGRGSYYQETGGRWVYLISQDGTRATRTTIRLGRQNPRFVEVLDGLQPGDQIITSGYQIYGEAEELIFSEPIF